MFSGIVERMGRVVERKPEDGGARLRVSAPGLVLAPGDSIAVDGVCVTAIRPQPGRFTAVLSPETLARTTLGLRRSGDRVNLERPLAADGRLGGHFVLGHVDARGTVRELRPEPPGARLVVRLSRIYDSCIVEKGSIAVDGVSLTIAACRKGEFEVALIPHTLEATTLGALTPGARVNLELDYLAKLVVRLVEARLGGPSRRARGRARRGNA